MYRLFALLFVASALFAQSMQQTTLAQPIAAPTTASSGGNTVFLASCQYVLSPGQAQSQGGIGNSLGANYYLLLVDSEFFRVNGVIGGSPCAVNIERGVQGSATASHLAGAIVYTAPASLFSYTPPYQGQQDHTMEQPASSRIEAYQVCRARKHWWQIWKRCTL